MLQVIVFRGDFLVVERVNVHSGVHLLFVDGVVVFADHSHFLQKVTKATLEKGQDVLALGDGPTLLQQTVLLFLE